MRMFFSILGVLSILAGAYALWAGNMYTQGAANQTRWAANESGKKAEMHRKFAEEDKQSAVQCFWAGGGLLATGVGVLFLASWLGRKQPPPIAIG